MRDDVGSVETQRLLGLNDPPDGVFCYNDLIALGAVRAVLRAGLRVPQDVAIIGCGNLHLANYLQVPLSSLDQQTTEQGEQAAKLIVSMIGGEQGDELADVRIPPRVVERASTRRAGMAVEDAATATCAVCDQSRS